MLETCGSAGKGVYLPVTEGAHRVDRSLAARARRQGTHAKVHAVVRDNLGSARARELERACDGVGDWEG